MITSASEEFSFPIMMSNPLANFTISSTSNNASASLSSSSRWRINSSRVFHHQEDHEVIEGEEEDDDDDDNHMEVRSMCEGFFPIYRRRHERVSFQSMELEMEERMDYLWEDFNEEEVEKEDVREVQRSREVCILQGTKMGRRPTSMLVMGKLLKALFSFRRKPAQSKIMRQRW